MESIWTEELITALRFLWKKGHSASLIAKTLGLTKNQVIGKVHRVGLPARPSQIKIRQEKELA